MPDFGFDAIGCGWTIRTPTPLPIDLTSALVARAETFDATYSRFRSDSLVARLAADGGSVRFPADVLPLLALYRELYTATGGAVSPLVGAALEHLGYDAGYSLRRRPGGVTVPPWDSRLRQDGTVLTAAEPLLLDVGAAGKGWLVDLLGEILTAAGVADFLVDGSGDLLHAGDESCLVGLEDPRDPRRVIGTVPLAGRALCASATNRRSWGDGLHHVIDARDGEPVRGVLATWVLAGSALLADGLATALFFTPPEELHEHFHFDFVRMLDSGAVDYSPTFPGELFT